MRIPETLLKTLRVAAAGSVVAVAVAAAGCGTDMPPKRTASTAPLVAEPTGGQVPPDAGPVDAGTPIPDEWDCPGCGMG